MTLPFALPDWVPWWVNIAVIVPAILFALAFLLMPFSIFGVKGRLEGVEARLDEIQGEIRSLALRLPERPIPDRLERGYALRATEASSTSWVDDDLPPIPPARPLSMSDRPPPSPTAGSTHPAADAPSPGWIIAKLVPAASPVTVQSALTDPVPPEPYRRVAFVAAPTVAAAETCARLVARYGSAPLDAAQVIVALGGDGFLLETLHATLGMHLPVFGMNCGSVGFLMNAPEEGDLLDRLNKTQGAVLHPLRMHAVTSAGAVEESLALNEVSLLRQGRQAAKIRISVDGRVRVPELICDGVLVATPAGSTAYNFSAHGPIVPLSANLLPLTPISAFRPRRWRGALLPSSADVLFEVLEREKRPVAAVADAFEVRDVASVAVSEDRSIQWTVLFDPDMALSERIIAEQFAV